MKPATTLRPPFPWTCLVTDLTVCPGGSTGLEVAVEAALAGGVNVVQLREKTISSRRLYELGTRLRRLTADAGAALVLNDRLDVALAVGADGVHLGAGSLAPQEVRRLSRELMIGCSVHTEAEARMAERSGADHLIVGTIFPSKTHPSLAASGPGLIREIASRVKLPLVGIGGITAENAAEVMAAGAVGVAVIREILADANPGAAAGRLVARVSAVRHVFLSASEESEGIGRPDGPDSSATPFNDNREFELARTRTCN